MFRLVLKEADVSIRNIYKITLHKRKMVKELKYKKTITTRFPDEVYKAIEKLVKDKKNEFPRYTEADAIRSAIVNHLKNKGYLTKGKNFL
jgi:hypothetical protein